MVTAHKAVTGYLDALRKLGGHSLPEAVETFLRTAATVRRKELSEAVEEFIELRAPLAESKDGKRPARSPVYLANVSAWLRELAAAFPGSGISELTQQHLDAYLASPGRKAAVPKSRNNRETWG